MLSKIILGTANFTQNYGILGDSLTNEQVGSILEFAYDNNISTLDAALGYGNLSEIISSEQLSNFNIITKISVLDDKETILSKIDLYYKNRPIYAVLAHDPQNINKDNICRVNKTLDSLRSVFGIKKIGVSIYDMNDLENFEQVHLPELIQIPLNPLNQYFNNEDFKKYISKHKVEVHARSLFLQGILLSELLPEKLNALHNHWSSVNNILKTYPSKLHGLMNWALKQDWVKNWVIGVASLDNLKDIIDASAHLNDHSAPEFNKINNPLVDPRNWKTA